MSHNIDHIFYINLDESIERRKTIENDLTEFNLQFERFPAIKKDFACLGCLNSHHEVLKIAKERGYKNVLILEDDFQFLVDKVFFESLLSDFFSSNIEYDVCMLAHLVQKQNDTQYDFLKQTTEAQTTSAYIVNSHYFDILINLYETNGHLLETTGMHWVYSNDQCWKTLQIKDKWFFFTTRVGKQRNGYSFISGCYTEGYW